jgi:hypothetical protein
MHISYLYQQKYLTTRRSCLISIFSTSSTNLQSSHNIFTKGLIYCEPKSINWTHNFKIIIDYVDDYARQWAKREKEDLDALSGWVIQTRISKLNGSMGTRSTSICIYLNVAKHLSLLLVKYDIICTNKVLNYEHVLYNQSKPASELLWQ